MGSGKLEVGRQKLEEIKKQTKVMNLFYTTNIVGQRAELPEEEARHCIQVLRHQIGDEIHLIDGKGGFYRGVIVESGKKHCAVKIEETVQEYGKRPFKIHLAIAPTKNNARIEWLLEKATEIGVDEITPLLCAHSERRVVKPARLEKVLLSATKQSLKAYRPQLNPMQTFSEFLQQDADHKAKYIAYLGEGVNGSLKENYQAGTDVCILIGPEGGFSPGEARAAAAVGFLPVSLGGSRLRTETAGLIAVHTIQLMNQ